MNRPTYPSWRRGRYSVSILDQQLPELVFFAAQEGIGLLFE